MGPKAKIGDIIEIPTSKGLAYAQYTHKHEKYGTLIRVFDGIFKSRPLDFTELTKKRHKYFMFSPIQPPINKGSFFIVGNTGIPEEARKFPIFRSGLPDRNGKIEKWWLFDGNKDWWVGKLTPELRALPLEGIFTETALVYAIENGWTPETDINTIKSMD
jgi:hypothetical protein